MIYDIANLKVEMKPKFERLIKQSEAYKSSGKPVLKIQPNLNDERYIELNKCTDEQKEYIFYSSAFCRGIIRHGRFFLHASAVVYDGEAYLFSAPSGMGKSTHTALWLKQFSGSYILNDDKPVILPQKDGISVWGTPFAGKTDLQINRGVPLKAICFLMRGNKNIIQRVSDERAIALMLNNTYRPGNSEGMNILLDMIEQVVSRVNIFEMSSNGEPSAAQVSYRAMKGM